MAVNYSSYSKKKKKPVAAYKPSTGGKALLKKKPATTVPPPSQGPVSTPPAGISGPAPHTLQGESSRIDAGADYNTNLAGVNHQLMQAALNYGGAPQVQQFGYDPTGGDTSSLVGVSTNPNDNSALSTIARNATQAAKGIDQTQNAQNTFFSSNRLSELQTNQDNAGRQRLAAQREYENAVAELVNQLQAARNARESAVRNAGITDIAAAESIAPEAAVVPPAAAPAAAKPKFKTVPGKDSKGNPGVWHIHPNGRRVFVRK